MRPTCARSSRPSRSIIRDKTGRDFPQDPREQMDLAVNAVFDSWNAHRAILYRRQERIPADLGTAVNIVAMVFGNLGMDSGTGVAFTRDPGTGQQGVYGDYLQNAQGEDVVAGIRNTVPLQDLEQIDAKSYAELMQIMQTLENHYKDLCDIEFTIERGKLWMLQTRVGKRTAAAAFRIAIQLVDQGLIDMDEALNRVTGDQLVQLMFPRFDAQRRGPADRQGASAPRRGPRSARRCSTPRTRGAAGRGGRGRHPGPPRDQPRRPARHDRLPGILTSRGGKTSHAAVVARGHGQDLRVRCRGARRRPGRPEVHRAGRDHGPRRRRDLHRRHLRASCTSARWRSCRRRWSSSSRASSTRRPTSWSARSTGSWRTPTPGAAWACTRTPTPARTARGPAGSAPRAWAWCGPSTCSSASAASSSSG